jgi:hypothetical protein
MCCSTRRLYHLIVGLTHVRATVCNPADPERSFEDAFLVDTGVAVLVRAQG